MRLRIVCLAVVAVCALSATNVQPVAACTGIRIKPKDGSIVVGRTLEFAADLESNVVVIPRAMEFVGTAPGDKPGVRWTSKYGCAGANAFGIPIIMDGLNEKGLAAAIFYFPGYAKYQKVTEADIGKTIAPWELPIYLLTTCASVDEAAEAAKKVVVDNVIQKNMGGVPPMHYIISDAGGHCAVIEYVNGELKIHNNPLGVVTNAPTFDWHVTNLRNYINLTVTNVPPVDIDGIKFTGLGQGSGMLGLPGDFTPPSRFVRAVAFSQSALPVATARDGVLQAFHILNQFDIPKGAARGTDNGKQLSDYTMWTSVSDLTNPCYYFRTFDNSRIRKVDLKQLDFNAGAVKTISMAGPEVIEDLSATAK